MLEEQTVLVCHHCHRKVQIRDEANEKRVPARVAEAKSFFGTDSAAAGFVGNQSHSIEVDGAARTG